MDGGALPQSPNRVTDLHINLRAIEGSVTLLHLIGPPLERHKGNKEARKQGSKEARKQGNKEARKQESEVRPLDGIV